MSEVSHLKSIYEPQETEELLKLHSSGTLSEVAYEVLENILKTRNVSYPERPTEIQIEEKPTPGWVKAGALLIAMFLLNFIWIASIKPITGGGFIPQAIFTLIPTMYLWKKLFPKNKKINKANNVRQ